MIRYFQASLACLLTCTVAGTALSADPVLDLDPAEKIVLIGNTQAERMQTGNHWETLLHKRFPEKQLVVRNLGWSGDQISSRLRENDFKDHGHTLFDHQPGTILAFFGYNESFAGPEGIPQFEKNLKSFIQDLRQLKYPYETYPRSRYEPRIQDGRGDVSQVPEIVLVSPIANEDLPGRNIEAGTRNNANLELYTAAMKRVCEQEQAGFVDLFTPTKQLMEQSDEPLTINGCHLNDLGDRLVGEALDSALFGEGNGWNEELEPLRGEVAEKNLQFWYDYRAVNGCYIYGERKRPFGVVNFPAEFAKLRKMTAVRDERIWKVAAGESVPEQIDDSGTGDFVEIESNFKNEIRLTTPEESQDMFRLADGFEVSLWASEVEFPNLENPVQFTFDAQGRMWIITMPTYPMVLLGTPVDDKVLILSDTNNDGKADQETIFADGLHLPLGIELGDGGAYISQQPNLVFLKDTDGDDRADEHTTVLHGFGTADSHHSIGAFEWGPGGDLIFLEGTFLHSQIETPYGLERVANAAVFRYVPRTEEFEVSVSYDFANPWGYCHDKWGQPFVADASGGNNYYATAFSGDLDHPRKHPRMQELLKMQWRPTCGCEIVSSRNFPESMQGDFLLNNCIGFQGVLQYRMKETGSGYFAEPVTPLLSSADPSFRPVDLQFGPDGSLYVLDWYNPLVGHMQHSLRDPNRDKHHGRIWKITYTGNDPVQPPEIANASIPQLLELLRTYEDRTRYRVRRELRDRETPEVVAAVDQWVSELDTNDPEDAHLVLEALWVKQHHAAVDEALLDRVLASEDDRARAAGVRVLCAWRDRVNDPLGRLQAAVHDTHPRVRLEAVRALSFFETQQAMDLAVESLIYEQDGYLEYCLNETIETLQRRLSPETRENVSK